jgi:hypothetical protein
MSTGYHHHPDPSKPVISRICQLLARASTPRPASTATAIAWGVVTRQGHVIYPTGS